MIRVSDVSAAPLYFIGEKKRGFGFNVFTALAFLVVFIPMEDFLLKFLPVPDVMYMALHFFSEVLIYALFAIVVVRKVGKREYFVRTAIEAPLLFFLAVATISMIWNQISLFDTLVHLRPVLRYIVLFYVIVNIQLTHFQILTLLKLMLFSGGLQVFFSLLQMLGGQAVVDIFMPRAVGLEVGDYATATSGLLSNAGREIGSVFGSLGDTVILGDFLIIIAALFLAMIRRVNVRVIVGLSLLTLVIGMTYSRGAMICFLLMLPVWAWFSLGGGKTIILSTLAGAGFIMMISFGSQTFSNAVFEEQGIIDNIMGVFTEKYISHAETNRLGSLIGVLPTALVASPLVGLGPDQEKTVDALNNSQHNFMFKVMSKEGFKDVYWVAWTSFYGLLGLFALLWMFWRVFKQAMAQIYYSQYLISRQLGLLIVLLLIGTTCILFINRAIEFRPYGAYFWLCLGLLFANIEVIKKHVMKESMHE